ncbi:aminotransferase class V-fold PLP-dependent enzyme [Patescibacteria group bacterium]|nr:aminotransferase class V-fold PLP-dependent enzyme [Patescibacteria group bacterium]
MFVKKRMYFDYAAGAAGNPSSPHEEGRRAKEVLENARLGIARLVDVKSDDVIFTSGATESNALAILGHVRALRLRAGRDAPERNNMHALYLPSAHASIVENMHLLADEGVDSEPLPIRNGRIDTEMLGKMLRSETVLVSMDAVCGETGVVWNTREVAEVLKKARAEISELERESTPATGSTQHSFLGVPAHILLHVDASQAPLTEKISRAHFGADVITFDASKVGAVRGIGVLVAHRTIPLVPLYGGGGQERGLRSGTEAPELARSFAAALSAAVLGREPFRAFAETERKRLIQAITSTIPNVFIQEGQTQAPHILNLSLPGRDTDYLVALLDEAGFAISSKSACETDSEEGSRAVLALTADKERARTTLRISWGPGTHSHDLTRLAHALRDSVAFVDSKTAR